MDKEHMDNIRRDHRQRPSAPQRNVMELPIAMDVLTLKETAALLHATPATVSRLMKEQSLPGRRIGNKLLFSAPAILQWLNHTMEE